MSRRRPVSRTRRCRVLPALFLLLLLTAASPGSSASASADTGATPAAGTAAGKPVDLKLAALADSCGEKVARLKAGQAKRPVTVTEEELNAYLEAHRDRLFESAVKSVQVNLKEDTFLIRGVVNLGEAKIKLESLIQKAFLWILSGDHRFESEVRFESASGQGKYTVRSIAIDGIPLPGFMIEYLATQAGNRQKPPMLPGKPFPMPYGLERAKVEARKATCYPAKPAAPAAAPKAPPATAPPKDAKR